MIGRIMTAGLRNGGSSGLAGIIVIIFFISLPFTILDYIGKTYFSMFGVFIGFTIISLATLIYGNL